MTIPMRIAAWCLAEKGLVFPELLQYGDISGASFSATRYGRAQRNLCGA